jgi:hypothetical protein
VVTVKVDANNGASARTAIVNIYTASKAAAVEVTQAGTGT